MPGNLSINQWLWNPSVLRGKNWLLSFMYQWGSLEWSGEGSFALGSSILYCLFSHLIMLQWIWPSILQAHDVIPRHFLRGKCCMRANPFLSSILPFRITYFRHTLLHTHYVPFCNLIPIRHCRRCVTTYISKQPIPHRVISNSRLFISWSLETKFHRDIQDFRDCQFTT